MRARRRRCSWCLLLLLACLAGCGDASPRGSDSAGDSSAPRRRIGLSILTTENPFFNELAQALREEAARHGYEVIVTSGEFDVAQQRNQVKNFIVDGVDAIVLCPCDSKAIGTAIQEANEVKIPVFTCDLACLAEGVEVVSHVATNNYTGGREAAKGMIEALGEAGGKVAILHFPQAESCLLRVQGFEDELREAQQAGRATNIQIVDVLRGDGRRDVSQRATQDLLQAHPDLAGIFAINDPSALGAVAALEKAGRLGQVKIIAFDGQVEGRQAIKDGKIFAEPLQFPRQIGKQTAQAVAAYMRGEPVEKEVLIPTRLYRREDALADPDLK